VDTVLDVGPQTALRAMVQMSERWEQQYVQPFRKYLKPLMKQLREDPTEELLALAEKGLQALQTVSTEMDRIRRQLDKLTQRVAADRETKTRRPKPPRD